MSQLQVPDSRGRFGKFGGRYVPETLMNALLELEQSYVHYRKDEQFQKEIQLLLKQYSGRPTPLYYAERLSNKLAVPKFT